MKTFKKISLVAMAFAVLSCGKEKPLGLNASTTYASIQDFYNEHGAPTETFVFNGNTGGTFTSQKGTQVIIPANAFVDQSGNVVTGTVTVEFRDIYSKADMLLSGMTTEQASGGPMVSAGEFFIRASNDNEALQMANGQVIEVEQPLQNGQTIDQGMGAFVAAIDSLEALAWYNSPDYDLATSTSSYIFSMYAFSSPTDIGTWCNSDNSSYFSAYPQTSLTIEPQIPASVGAFPVDMFLVFHSVNSMVHVYGSGGQYTYQYAPLGLTCTAVAVGVKNGKLYASFTPVTIGSNQTINAVMAEISSSNFMAQLDGIN